MTKKNSSTKETKHQCVIMFENDICIYFIFPILQINKLIIYIILIICVCVCIKPLGHSGDRTIPQTYCKYSIVSESY